MQKVAIILLLLLSGCGESPEFYAAKAEWNAAQKDWEEADARNDREGRRNAFRREQVALKKEIESCRKCSKDWKNDPGVKAILAAQP